MGTPAPGDAQARSLLPPQSSRLRSHSGILSQSRQADICDFKRDSEIIIIITKKGLNERHPARLSGPYPSPALGLKPTQAPGMPSRGFSNVFAVCIRWPTYWSFSFSIRPSNEYSGLISFRMDWCDLLGVQGTLKSLL